MKRRVFLLLAFLLALVPLGLLSDAPAWGEWDAEYFQKVLGYVPEGIRHIGSSIHLPILLSDYQLRGVSEVAGYYLSAFVGVALLFGLYYTIYLLVKRRS